MSFSDKCGVCKLEIDDNINDYNVLTEKGVLGLNNASKERCTYYLYTFIK